MSEIYVSTKPEQKVKAKKDGKMDDGDWFCFKGETYFAYKED